MPRIIKTKPTNIEQDIMAKVTSNQITMKPHWHFVAGSLLMAASLVGLSIGAIFLTNLTLFLLRQHGPMGQVRLELMISNFPWWIPALALVGIVFGVSLLKKYDLSYKKNFFLIILGFIISIILAAFIIDRINLGDVWYRQGPIRRFYQQNIDDQVIPRGRGPGRMPRL